VGYNYHDANGNLSNQTYDPNGPMMLGYTYDAENQLIAVNTDTYYTPAASRWKSEFVYDGRGRLRVRKDYNWPSSAWVLIGETRYVYDGMRVIQERNSANTPTVAYTRGQDLSGSTEGAGGIGGLLGRSHGYSGGTFGTHSVYYADGNGNITTLLNSSQSAVATYRYDPYGNTTFISGTLANANTYRFSSKEVHPNSGMYYYGYRWYAPNLQRWVNRDPLMEEGGFNLYGFVHNDPLGFVDDAGERVIRPGPGNPGGRNPYRYPNGRPIYIPPLPPRQNPSNPWPNGRQPSMCITIPVMGRDMQRAGRRAEALAQQLLGDPSDPQCPPPPPSPCPAPGPSLPPYIPNSGSYVNAPPDIGLTVPSRRPRTILLPRGSGPVIVAPGTIIIWI
jgi:RHS repeat-associated protein